MDGEKALKILTDTSLIYPLNSEQAIKEEAMCTFLDEYEKLEVTYPDIEEKIASVKGLMSELFVFKQKKHKGSRKHRRSFLEDPHKKKVRFNIPNTIYDPNSFQDDTDSFIGPPSVYSNSSPPVELTEEYMIGSTHSSENRRGSAEPRVIEPRSASSSNL